MFICGITVNSYIQEAISVNSYDKSNYYFFLLNNRLTDRHSELYKTISVIKKVLSSFSNVQIQVKKIEKLKFA